MKIIKHTDTTHVITFVPRQLATGLVTFNLYNEATRESGYLTCSYNFLNGLSFLTFEMLAKQGDKFQILIQCPNNIIYRGKMIVE
jgi:hypothetical protein